jgi:sterol desaturase/sphingolipid hydroxylase (fatty acid hydroxylase superfamily)
MRAFRVLVRWAGMPVLLVGAAWATFELLARGANEGAVLGGMGVLVFLIVWGLERLVPFKPEWNANDGQRWHDVGHTLFGTFLGGRLGQVMTLALTGSAAAWIAERTDGGLWPADVPVAVQIAIVFLAADLGRYVQHRAMHEVPLLWRFHQLHHSIDVLNVWKTSRNHFVERLFQQLFLLGPVLALGAPAEVVLPFVVANSYLGVFDHSNVDFRLGPLEYVVMGPSAHRLHHSRDLREGNTNFGTSLVVWDWVFGTYTNPVRRAREGAASYRVGIADDDMPSGFVAQVIDPFKPRRAHG